jgi:hypothetical protein
MLKKLIVSLVMTYSTLALSGLQIQHTSCNIAIEPNYSNDGVNAIITQMSNLYLKEKGFHITNFSDLDPAVDTMIMKLDIRTDIGRKKGSCRAVLSLRAAKDPENRSLVLANLVEKEGKILEVSSKCVTGVVEAIKNYPRCSMGRY